MTTMQHALSRGIQFYCNVNSQYGNRSHALVTVESKAIGNSMLYLTDNIAVFDGLTDCACVMYLGTSVKENGATSST